MFLFAAPLGQAIHRHADQRRQHPQGARAAGLAAIVTPTTFTRHHDFAGALRVLPSLVGVTVDRLAEWRSEQEQAAGALS